MINDLTLTQLRTILDQAQTALVLLGPRPTFDQAASAASFYLALKELKSEVNFCAPNELNFPDLFGQDELRQKLGNKDLSISFDYSETAVDKVSYHIDEEQGKFYLVVKPQKGHKPLDPKTVSFDLTGAQADVIFLFGVHSFEMLEHLYASHQDVFDTATVVAIHSFETEIGDLKLDISGQSSWAESTFGLIERLGLEMTAEGANNLLLAIDQATEWLTSFTATADTFEVVSRLMRAGGKRTRRPMVEVAPASGFVPASEIILDKGKSAFETALERAREQKNKDKKSPQGLVQEASQKSKKKNRLAEQNQKDSMRDKNFVPDNLSRRV